MGRAPCCDKANVKKGPWSPEEDAKLKSYIEQHGTVANWITLPQEIGLKRCGKSCRLRWLNYLRPNIKHGGFSEEEDDIICRLYITIGSRWSIIASQLPGRTDNDVKNYWNTRLKRKLLGKQRKEPQHRRRAAAGQLKQQAKGGDNGDIGITGWPQQPALMYTIDHVYCGIDDELASIWNPLVDQFGGRFCTDGANHESSFVMPSTVSQQQIYDDRIRLGSPPLQESSGAQGLQCPNGLSTELDEILGFNSVELEGTDCFYGIWGMVEESNATTMMENMNWNEVSSWMSPLMYPNLMKGYQEMQQ